MEGKYYCCGSHDRIGNILEAHSSRLGVKWDETCDSGAQVDDQIELQRKWSISTSGDHQKM